MTLDTRIVWAILRKGTYFKNTAELKKREKHWNPLLRLKETPSANAQRWDPTLSYAFPSRHCLLSAFLQKLCPLRKDSPILATQLPVSAPILNKLILNLLLSGEWQGLLRRLKKERETTYLNVSGEVGGWGADS